jgi:hypothetical protein
VTVGRVGRGFVVQSRGTRASVGVECFLCDGQLGLDAGSDGGRRLQLDGFADGDCRGD